MGVGTDWGERVADQRPSGGDADDELVRAIERHRPTLTCLGDVFRQPTAEPLATLTASLVLVVLAWQTYVTAMNQGLAVAALVVVAFAAAYLVAKRCWAVQNEYVATVLARRDLGLLDEGEN